MHVLASVLLTKTRKGIEMNESKIQGINNLADRLKAYGYDVYLAKNKLYGFYTDGKRVITFEWQIGGIALSGCYHSKLSGNGWRIADGVVTITQAEAEEYLNRCAPHWAISKDTQRGCQVAYTTPLKMLEIYGSSSGFKRLNWLENNT